MHNHSQYSTTVEPLMGDHPDERPYWQETPKTKEYLDCRPCWWGHPDETTLNYRPHWLEATVMRDHPDESPPNERPPWLQDTLTRISWWGGPKERPPWLHATVMRDHPSEHPPWLQAMDERPSWWKTTLTRDHPVYRPPWWEATLITGHTEERPP